MHLSIKERDIFTVRSIAAFSFETPKTMQTTQSWLWTRLACESVQRSKPLGQHQLMEPITFDVGQITGCWIGTMDMATENRESWDIYAIRTYAVNKCITSCSILLSWM